MIKFSWFNVNMKNSISSFKKVIISKYLLEDDRQNEIKKADINILLNRVKLDKIREGRKKILFSAAASLSVLLFGFMIF
jgi:hypothetical protein